MYPIIICQFWQVYITTDLFYISGQSGSLTFKVTTSSANQREFDAARQENFHKDSSDAISVRPVSEVQFEFFVSENIEE